jgi:uncharacterized membrane protein YkoI
MKLTRRTMIVGSALLALAAGGTGAAVAIGGGDEADQQATGPAADRARDAALERYPGAKVTGVERDSDQGEAWEVEVTRQDGSTVDVSLDSDYRVVRADEDSERDDAADDDAEGADDEADVQASGPSADRARDAALARHPGRVTSVERESDGGATWEVEITRADGSSVEVGVDRQYRVVGSDVDDD